MRILDRLKTENLFGGVVAFFFVFLLNDQSFKPSASLIAILQSFYQQNGKMPSRTIY
jgi:hypothetical protein